MLPELVRWLGRYTLGIVQASLGGVLRVLLWQTGLRLVEAWVPKTTVLRRLMCLAEATLLALALETIEVTRWNCRNCS